MLQSHILDLLIQTCVSYTRVQIRVENEIHDHFDIWLGGLGVLYMMNGGVTRASIIRQLTGEAYITIF